MSGSSSNSIVQLADRRVDLIRQQVLHADGKTVALTTREAQLLGYLTERSEQDVSRDELLDQVWEYRANYATRAVDVAMRRLRSKVEPDPSKPVHLISVHGVGYRFVPPPSDTARFDTPAPPPARTTNLRSERSTFFGRTEELSLLGKLFTDGARLVSVLGPGGVGKTRLALAAARLALQGSDGVWVVDLTDATDLDGVLSAVGRALGVPLVHSADNVEILGQSLANRGRLFVVFDNFEHVIDAASATLGRWLQLAPKARFLVTSRERLRLQGEHTIELQPLDDESARELFLDRARAAGADVDDANAGEIDAILRKLDRLPLAIELAAPRARLLSLEKLRERLDHRFRVLAAKSAGDGSDRQSTLRKAIDWSWDLLDDDERAALAQCSVFVGGFSLDGAESVVQLSDDAPWTLDVIEALRDKSLLRVSEPDELPGEVRFSMYESIRAYAAERLVELDPDEETVDRHASWVLTHCGELMGRLQGHGGLSNFLQLAVEADNLLAIQSRRRRSHPEQSLQATLLLEHVLRTRGPTSLHHRLLDEALEQANALDDDTVRARLHLAKGRALRVRGAVDEAKQELGRALPLFAGQEDAEAITGELEALAVLATLNTDQGRIDEAEAIVQAALPQAEAAGLLRLRGLLTGLLAGHQLTRGHVGQAERLCTEAIQLLTEAGDEVSMATNLSTLGLLCAEVGRVDEARNYIERAQRIHRAWGDLKGHATTLNSLASLHARSGDLEATMEHSTEALRLFREIGFRRFAGLTLLNLGATQWALGEPETALENFVDASETLSAAGDGVLDAMANFYRASLLASRGDLTGATAAFDRGDELVRGLSYRQASGVRLVASGFLDMARARQPDAPDADALLSHASDIARDAEASPVVGIQFMGKLLSQELGRA